jgi:hypothetical protein
MTFAVNIAQGGSNNTTMRNRIINGAMVIDQRNAGASVSGATAVTAYCLDRFLFSNSTDGAITVQQDTTAPTGFVNSLKIAISTADASLSVTQNLTLIQRIEGYNIADLGWGTANAKTVTLSFWVYSSLTGTFGGVLKNSASNRSYPFTYTISSANTWTQASITIAGDTTGTWLTTNGIGIQLCFGLGAGTDRSGTAGAWNANNNTSATGATSVIGTNGATFYLTGVQLEVGSTATSFDYRPYGTELQLCQRYYYKTKLNGDVFCNGQVYGANSAAMISFFPVTMRTIPSALEQSGTASHYSMWKADSTMVTCTSVPSFDSSTADTAAITIFTSTSLVGTAGQCSTGFSNNSSAYLGWSAEL